MGIGRGWLRGGTGSMYNLLTIEMLSGPIVAMDWEEHARPTAL